MLLKKEVIFHNCLFEAKVKCCENGGLYDEDVKSHYDYIKDEFEINKGRFFFLFEALRSLCYLFGEKIEKIKNI